MTLLYDDTVPQANQQISTTQPIIQGNFEYLQTYINNEHQFDDTGALNMYHRQCSMPSQALLAAYPYGGTVGVYYVNTQTPVATPYNLAEYYDGTLNYNLNLIRAWVNFSVGAGPAFTVTVNGSFNVSGAGVVRGSKGNFVISFTNAIPTANYAASITGMRTANPSVLVGQITGNATYANSIKDTSLAVSFTDQNAVGVDPVMGSVVIYGF